MLLLKQTLALIVMWNNDIYTCVCVSVGAYFINIISTIFSLNWLFVFVNIQNSPFDVKSNERCFFEKTEVKVFFLCTFKIVHLFFLHIKLPFNVEWLQKGQTCKKMIVSPFVNARHCSVMFCKLSGCGVLRIFFFCFS